MIQVNIGQLPLGSGRTLENTFPNLGVLVNVLLKNIISLAGIIFLGLLIFGGLQLIIGAGSNDAKKTETGKQAVTNAVIGLVIVVSAFFIVQVIEMVTGVTIFNNTN